MEVVLVPVVAEEVVLTLAEVVLAVVTEVTEEEVVLEVVLGGGMLVTEEEVTVGRCGAGGRDSHLRGCGLDAPVGDQGPVAPGAGIEGALLCLFVDLHQEGLMIQLFVLVG